MKIKLTLCYDGTAYAGWQIQENALTVQQVLEKALQSLTGENIKTVASGRTDAGVHALGQVVSFETESTIPPIKFYKALNTYLPADIKAVKSEQVFDGFDARKSAKKKTYEYYIYLSETECPLKEKFAVMVSPKLDVSLMKKAGKILCGMHDFKCMCSTGSSVKTTVRTVYSVKIKKTENNLKIAVTGNGFLYNMVRIMVGTLVKIGLKEMTLKQLKLMLKTGDRELGGKTFPAKGLCLKSVEYEN
ncbi:MAG: tRNA pseudouridine(38-40) synthase TruA [Clostridia bacterium]|nr:tRNA pseudouridine(38-40) synthase TruA [Clostridia bacterium]